MSNDKPSKPAADQLAKELKSSLARERPKTWKPILALIVVCSLILAALLYWFIPRGRPQVLQVVAIDGIFTTDESPEARAQLFAQIEDTAPRLRGHSVAFNNQQGRSVTVETDAKGQAATEWPTEKEEVASFLVRFVDRDNKQGSLNESGRVFIWPKDVRIVVVDADETLADISDDAGTALNQAVEDGWQIAFLALDGNKAQEFRQARGRLEAKFPSWPILGRSQYPANDSTESA